MNFVLSRFPLQLLLLTPLCFLQHTSEHVRMLHRGQQYKTSFSAHIWHFISSKLCCTIFPYSKHMLPRSIVQKESEKEFVRVARENITT